MVPVGSTATFTYVVTNAGNVPLSGVAVRDDNGTPANPADDFDATFVERGRRRRRAVGPDRDLDLHRLAHRHPADQYTNLGTAPPMPPARRSARTVTDANPDNHFGVSGTTGH